MNRFRNTDEISDEPVSDQHPWPSTIIGPATVEGRLAYFGPFQVPGIAAADALDALDQMGTLITVQVPKKGAIVNCLFHDLDDEGITKELWIFRETPTLAASDAAFSLDDVSNRYVVGVLDFSVFKDGVNNQIGKTADLPLWYDAPDAKLYMGVKTNGADNIAAGSMPMISMVIERYSED